MVLSPDGRNFMVNQLVDMEWQFGGKGQEFQHTFMLVTCLLKFAHCYCRFAV